MAQNSKNLPSYSEELKNVKKKTKNLVIKL